MPVGPDAEEALATIDVILSELETLRAEVDPAVFDSAVSLISAAQEMCGRVHVTGIGKPEHVAHYAAALLSSTGTPATFLHGTEATHGSVGQLQACDVVIAISNSGETSELLSAIAAARTFGVVVIAVTGNPDSRLSDGADHVLVAHVDREGGPP